MSVAQFNCDSRNSPLTYVMGWSVPSLLCVSTPAYAYFDASVESV